MPKAKKNIAPPKVLKVRDPPKEKGIKEIHPYLPECPSLQIIAGSVRQGKSNLLLNYLLNENFYGPTYYDETKIIRKAEVIWIKRRYASCRTFFR